MPDQPTTVPAAGTDAAPAVTIADALYEASSLLNTFPTRPAPVYVSTITHFDGTAEVTFQMDTTAAVMDWAHAMNAEFSTTRRVAGQHSCGHLDHSTEFPHPFHPRVKVRVYRIEYTDGGGK